MNPQNQNQPVPKKSFFSIAEYSISEVKNRFLIFFFMSIWVPIVYAYYAYQAKQGMDGTEYIGLMLFPFWIGSLVAAIAAVAYGILLAIKAKSLFYAFIVMLVIVALVSVFVAPFYWKQ